jgi:3D (Asp-Asp-Asp) domain-containing protein
LRHAREIVFTRGVRVASVISSQPTFALAFALATTACGWANGATWVNEPISPAAPAEEGTLGPRAAAQGKPLAVRARTLGAGAPGARGQPAAAAGPDESGIEGRLVGTFRNTYYDFPAEGEPDAKAPVTSLMSASCTEIAKVPRAFHDAVCVQGSGALRRGGTVSFAKRDCPCAEVCPRTGQRICYDALDPAAFPYGRGAAGKAIRPLRTIAADTSVLPMGTVVYVPELEGATAANGGEPSDGCFVVEDRGLRVQGEHIDIFTGSPETTALVNANVPSNGGVRVYVDAPRCARLRAAP